MMLVSKTCKITIYSKSTDLIEDLGPFLLTDYYHRNHTDINTAIFNSDFNIVAVPAVNTLINGRNNFNCSLKAAGDNTPCISNAGLAKFKFKQGKKHRLRLINAGASALQTFSVDGHNLTVIANDFVPVVPYQAQCKFLGRWINPLIMLVILG